MFKAWLFVLYCLHVFTAAGNVTFSYKAPVILPYELFDHGDSLQTSATSTPQYVAWSFGNDDSVYLNRIHSTQLHSGILNGDKFLMKNTAVRNLNALIGITVC